MPSFAHEFLGQIHTVPIVLFVPVTPFAFLTPLHKTPQRGLDNALSLPQVLTRGAIIESLVPDAPDLTGARERGDSKHITETHAIDATTTSGRRTDHRPSAILNNTRIPHTSLERPLSPLGPPAQALSYSVGRLRPTMLTSPSSTTSPISTRFPTWKTCPNQRTLQGYMHTARMTSQMPKSRSIAKLIQIKTPSPLWPHKR